jgi:hypothetical protein
VIAYTDRSIAAGEPILHTYGDLSDAQLLQTYGFVQQLGQANPHNYALMPFGTLVEAVQMLPEEAVEVGRGLLHVHLPDSCLGGAL